MEYKIPFIIITIIIFLFFFKISKKVFNLAFFLFLGFLTFLLISGCTQGEKLNIKRNLEDVEENTLTRIADVPFPPGTKIDVERSLIMGEGKTWSGQLVAYVPLRKREVFNFYVKNFPDFSWKEQTTIRGEVSILNFLGENSRVAIITVEERRFNKAQVIISVSPYTEEFEKKVGDYINEKYLELPFKD